MFINGEIIKIYNLTSSKWAFNDVEFTYFSLVSNNERIFCCGNSLEIFEGENVTLEGEMEISSKGKRFKFTSLKMELESTFSLKKYLNFICGDNKFDKIYDYIKENSSHSFFTKSDENKYIIQEMYNMIESGTMPSNINGVGKKTKEKILSRFQKNKEFEKTYVSLSKFGLSMQDCLKINKSETMKDKDVVNIIQKNPFKLMNLVGFSYNKCDILYAKNGGKYNDSCRLLASIIFSLNDELARGHTFCTSEILLEKCNAYLNVSLYNNSENIDSMELLNAISSLIKYNKIVNDNGRIYLKYVWEMEEYIRKYISNILKKPSTNEDYSTYIEKYEKYSSEKTGLNIKLGKEQKESIQNSLNNQVSIITGGPGTGKTSSLACIIKCLLEVKHFDKDEIALCAPTGKASRRMMESINGQLGTEFVATTIHSLLEVDPTDENLEKFIFNENNKLSKKVVVIDEVSMMDLFTTYSLLSALMKDTIVILVGDIEQLPPVGYGYFLRDSILSNVPCVKLLEIHRQKSDSTIIELSQNIRNETLNYNNLLKKNDFCFVDQDGWIYKKRMEYIVNLFDRAQKRDGIDNVMVLTPLKGNVSDKKMGAQQISIAIQEKILPHKNDVPEFSKNGWIFRVGSKVIVSKNDNKKGIVNGEIGYITKIDILEKTIEVDFPDKDSPITLENENIEYLKLAYAITVHKSQGSEWKNVIYCCYSETAMNKKALVYTAITRAKQNLVIVGEKKSFLNCINNKDQERRSRILN